MTVWLPGSVDFVFLSHRDPEGAGGPGDDARVAGLSGDALTALIATHEQRYDQHFEQVGCPFFLAPFFCLLQRF